MKVRSAKRDFLKFLKSRGDTPGRLTPAGGVAAMIAFYRDVRAVDCVEESGDMLLFKWGVYDRGTGERFEVGITRQLIAGQGVDEDICQLGLAFRFEPTDVLRRFGKEDRWCESLAELVEFERFATAHPVLMMTGSRRDGEWVLEFESAG